eukprot:1522399-Amphidinium_carterae.2
MKHIPRGTRQLHPARTNIAYACLILFQQHAVCECVFGAFWLSLWGGTALGCPSPQCCELL